MRSKSYEIVAIKQMSFLNTRSGTVRQSDINYVALLYFCHQFCCARHVSALVHFSTLLHSWIVCRALKNSTHTSQNWIRFSAQSRAMFLPRLGCRSPIQSAAMSSFIRPSASTFWTSRLVLVVISISEFEMPSAMLYLHLLNESIPNK